MLYENFHVRSICRLKYTKTGTWGWWRDFFYDLTKLLSMWVWFTISQAKGTAPFGTTAKRIMFLMWCGVG